MDYFTDEVIETTNVNLGHYPRYHIFYPVQKWVRIVCHTCGDSDGITSFPGQGLDLIPATFFCCDNQICQASAHLSALYYQMVKNKVILLEEKLDIKQCQVKRSSGEVEDDWLITGPLHWSSTFNELTVKVQKNRTTGMALEKWVPLKEFVELNPEYFTEKLQMKEIHLDLLDEAETVTHWTQLTTDPFAVKMRELIEKQNQLKEYVHEFNEKFL